MIQFLNYLGIFCLGGVAITLMYAMRNTQP